MLCKEYTYTSAPLIHQALIVREASLHPKPKYYGARDVLQNHCLWQPVHTVVTLPLRQSPKCCTAWIGSYFSDIHYIKIMSFSLRMCLRPGFN